MTSRATPTAQQVREHAATLGFDLCGVAPVGPFPELGFLHEWLDRGYAGEMGWMARTAALRADVQRVVPGARSVVVTATIYNTDRPYSSTLPFDRARVSRYACGDDYHDVLRARMNALLAWMRDESPEPFDARAFVDTGPVQERVFAQYAGLGWVGKNTCLINRSLGSWLFLGVLISTLPFEPDTEGLEQCGSCTRCLDACPTGALVEPGVLDSTRCISYLTIEHRSAIPESLRPSMGTHVYGCDICQEVCPYNQPPPTSADPAWQPREGLDAPRLVDLWRASDDELRRLRKGSAMTRAKLPALRRNIAVAIGNSSDADALAALDESSTDRPSIDDPLVQEHVESARARIARRAARLRGGVDL